MLFTQLAFIFSRLLLIAGSLQILPLIIALAGNETVSADAFMVSAGLMLVVGGGGYLAFRGTGHGEDRRLLIILPPLLWAGIPVFGAVPFMISGILPDFIDAYFEAVSGFTTTGASVIPVLDGVPASIIFWRALLNWIGGITTLVIAFSILPFLNVGALRVFHSSLPRGEGQYLLARMRGVLLPLWRVYVIITVVAWIALWASGMSSFEALCFAMAAISTGGFSPVDGSVGAYASPLIELVLMTAALIGALNFSFHWLGIRGWRRDAWKAEELRVFGLILAFGFVTLVLTLAGTMGGASGEGGGLAKEVWLALMTAISVITTTGFIPEGGTTLPLMGAIFVFGLLFIGGMTGSTTGGIKVMRLLIMVRHSAHEMDRLAHPHSARTVQYQGKTVRDDDLAAIWTLVFSMLAMAALASLVLSAFHLSFLDALAVSVASLTNAGPAIDMISDTFTGYHMMEVPNKIASIVLMIAGRVETAAFLAFLGLMLRRQG